MSYEPTNWKNGDIVTADKLNKLEQGVASAGGGGGVLIVTADIETGALNKTWQEIHDAVPLVWLEREGNYNPLYSIYESSGDYVVTFGNGSAAFTATSADGYPVFSDTPK